MAIKIIFWVLIFILLYSYLGYIFILFIIKQLKNLRKKNTHIQNNYEPEVSLIIAAYNEKEIIRQKIENTYKIDYSPEKLHLIWITDGSDDGSEKILQGYPNIILLHQPERKGKIHAINRGMKYIKTPIVIFSDANSMLSANSVKELVKELNNPEVGCVAGNKRIFSGMKEDAVIAGESIYWKIESLIKNLESSVNSVIGAAGELFAIKSELFERVDNDIILDDFVISLIIARKGYKIKFAEKAYAYETGSASINDEIKRKVRIAAGSIQTMLKMKDLIYKYGFLSFQYLSHKILRWTIIPFSFIFIFLINAWLAFIEPDSLYFLIFLLQLFFYLFVIVGYLLKDHKIKFRFIFLPFYVFFMNYSLVKGWIKYFRKEYTVNWDKAKRA
jgi:cellulose synthase/poly-beta-1,6-N-acetylglucosamine synthase-like glycosyltransferase